MNNKTVHKIHIIGIVKLRPNIEPVKFSYKFPNNEYETLFKLHFESSFYDKFLTEFKGANLRLESSCIIEIFDTITLPRQEFKSRGLLVQEIEKINRFIDILRYSAEKKPTGFIHLKNIGINDFEFYKIIIDGKTETTSIQDSFGNKVIQANKIEKFYINIPFEWLTFTKAVDLLDYGNYNESLVIGFNLLDYSVQKSLKELMINLEDDKEKEKLLRQIKEQRLKTYLTVLFKSLTGKSFFNNKLKVSDLEKINTLRNKTVHNGEICTYEQAKSGLKIIYKIITELNKYLSKKFEIPSRIIFY